ncbi:hypothetical protein RND81_14G095300 [Saponaria officinalis]|uniref:Uncharacterized protein n=1 Tax=Saponaria officinalis TaxID=3572 RepID=A0AAW1GMP1_SAPOF
MGNYLVLCITHELKSRETILKNSNILQIMKIDGKILEFTKPILVKDLIQNNINCYVGMFKDATQPLPLDYKLNKGKVYYLLPCLKNQTLDSTSNNQVNVEESRKPSRKSTRIKVVISREKLKQLLESQEDQRVEELVLGSVGSKRVCSSSASTWMPRLESIPEDR